MTVPVPAEIAASVCASLATAARFDAPYQHVYAADLFPQTVIDALAELPFDVPFKRAAAGTASGRRDDNAGRLFVSAPTLARFPLLQGVAEALQSAPVIAAIGRICGAKLAGAYLRLEYAIDTEGFWLAPHTDIGVKKFTCLISLADDSLQSSLGTDIYNPDHSLYRRAPFRRNGALMFVPSAESWHGFAPRPIAGRRKSLILNYVGADWRDRDQLAFPDAPVATA